MPPLASTGARRAAIAVCTATAMTFGLAFASPAEAHEAPPAPTVDVVEPTALPAGASSDVQAISSAADAYSTADAGSAADLADAAAADSATDIPAFGDTVTVGNGAVLEVGQTSSTLTGPDGDTIGIATGTQGPDRSSTLVDGVVLTGEVAPSTDLVTRATASGVQLVAVLADEHAPRRVDFDLDLPAGAELTQSPDGSVAISVPTEKVELDAAASDRFDAQVAQIIGDVESLDDVTDEQWAQLDALPPVPSTTTTVHETVAVIAAPWAVDANGAPVETSYELEGTTLTQVVDIDDSTAFPVTADPSLAFVWKAAKCVGQLGLMTLAVAKAASMVVKLVKYISGLGKTSKVAKAWSTLVGSKKTIDGFKALASALGKLLKKLAKEGFAAMKKYATTTVVLSASFTMLTLAGDTIAAIIGIDECVDLALGRY